MDSAGYVAARHADFSPAGPAALSSPGITFTPVKPGETVLLYAVGFAQTSLPITDQMLGLGSLAALPVVTIGGIPATVEAAESPVRAFISSTSSSHQATRMAT